MEGVNTEVLAALVGAVSILTAALNQMIGHLVRRRAGPEGDGGQAGLRDDIAEIRSDVAKIAKTLNGNGDPRGGLVAMVQRQEANLEYLQAQLKAVRPGGRKR